MPSLDRVFDALSDVERLDHAVVALFAAVFRAGFWLDNGTLVARDSFRYIEWCGDLSLGTLFGTRALVYSGYWLPYCGWLKATGGAVEAWIAVQFLLSTLTCVLVYETARLLVDRRAGLVAGGLFVAQPQVYYWFTRPQSEFMMTFVFALAVWRLAHYHLAPTRRNRLLALASLAWVATVRPNGLPIVFGYLVYDFLPDSSDLRLDLFFSAKANLVIAGSLASAALYRFWFGWARGSFMTPWREGLIITPNRIMYDYSPEPAGTTVEFVLANAEHLVAIALLRGAWFFSPVMPGWSTTHAAEAILSLGTLVVGALLGIRAAVGSDDADDGRTDGDHLLRLWATPLVMVVLTSMVTWVPGTRNFLGPAAVVYALFTGYFVTTFLSKRGFHRFTDGRADQSSASGRSASESST